MCCTRTPARWRTTSASFLAWGLLVTCLLPSHATAQVNIESQRGAATGEGLSGTVNTDFELRTGNVEHFRLGVGGRVDYQSGTTSSFLVGRWSLGFLGSTRFNNAGLVHLRTMFASRGRSVPEAYVQANYDEPRLLEFRAVAGAGARVPLVRRASLELWLGSGLMFEHERLALPDTSSEPRRTSVFRQSWYLTGRAALSNHAAIMATAYAQPRVVGAKDVRILSEVSLDASISNTLSLTIEFSLRYDSQPPDEVKPLDTQLRNGIAVAF